MTYGSCDRSVSDCANHLAGCANSHPPSALQPLALGTHVSSLPLVSQSSFPPPALALLQLHVEAADDSASQLVLDTRDLTLHGVQLLPSGQALQFSMGQPHKVRCLAALGMHEPPCMQQSGVYPWFSC
jgi:hypothetical protein